MDKIAKLKAKRAAALDAAKAIDTAAKAENRDLTDAEVTQMEAHVAAANATKAEIVTAEAAAAKTNALRAGLDADLAEIDAAPAPRARGDTPGRPIKPVVTSQRELAADDANRGFRTPREYFSAVLTAGQSNGSNVHPLLRPLAAVGSDENQGGQDPFGGFLIPPGFVPNLLTVSVENDPTLGRTMDMPMSSPVVNIPARVDKNHTSSVSGGLQFTRRSETGAGTSNQMQFEQVSLRANPLMGLNYTSEELLVDSPISIAALLASGYKDELAATLFNEKLNGTGAGQFLGAMNAPCLVSVAAEGGQTAKTIVAQNIANMRSRCWHYSDAIWIANHDTFPQLYKLSVPVGTGGSVVYMPSMVEDRPDMLMGRPIFYSEFAQTLGTTGDLLLGNWSQYIVGTLQGANSQESIHVRFVNNERTFRVTVRNDGQPWWKSALTPKKGSNTLSPFVALATR